MIVLFHKNIVRGILFINMGFFFLVSLELSDLDCRVVRHDDMRWLSLFFLFHRQGFFGLGICRYAIARLY